MYELEKITLPSSVKFIGEQAFFACTSLTSVKIPNGITEIGTETFFLCTSLKSVTIPDSVLRIGDCAFYDCTSLADVTIPSSVESVENYAFGYNHDSENQTYYIKSDSFKIYGYSGTAGEKYATDNGFSFTAVVTPLTPVISKFASSASAVKLTWKKVSSATGYRIYRYNSKTKKYTTAATIKNASTVSYKDTKLKAGTVYVYKIKAYTKYGNTVTWSSASKAYSTATKPSTVKISKVNSSKTAVKLTWGKLNCTGYTIQQYNSKTKKWVTVKNVKASTTAYKISGLKKNTAYKFRIRAYTTAGKTKVAGAWSAVKTVKTNK